MLSLIKTSDIATEGKSTQKHIDSPVNHKARVNANQSRARTPARRGRRGTKRGRGEGRSEGEARARRGRRGTKRGRGSGEGEAQARLRRGRGSGEDEARARLGNYSNRVFNSFFSFTHVSKLRTQGISYQDVQAENTRNHTISSVSRPVL